MLELRNITKTYHSKYGGESRALNEISLVLPDKGLVFICGKSGSGKSTLLNIASGMDASDGGELIIDGKSSVEFKQSDFDVYRSTYAGYIFQNFGLIDELSVRENVSLSVELQGKIPSSEQIEAALSSVGLEDYGERKSFELSGGQCQRVSIARALIKNPKIVFADEPTGSLDAATGRQIFELFKELSKSRLVIIISHDTDSAIYYGDRVVTLADGEVLSDLTKTSEVDVAAARAEYQSKIDKAFSETAFEKLEAVDSFESTTTKFSFARALKIGISNFKTQKIRFIFMCFLTVIALTVFCLADTMRNYNYHTASVNTYEKLNINTLLLINNRTDITDDGNEVNIPAEFDAAAIQQIADACGEPYPAYVCDIRLSPYQPIDEKALSASEKILESRIGEIVEASEEFDEKTLKSFYNSTLELGRYPQKSADAVEILISDYLADSLMCYGARSASGEIIPNSGYENVLNFYFDYNGIALKIVGIFGTDYKRTAYDEERSFEYAFNSANIYTAALTTKRALYNHAAKNIAIPTLGYFDADGNAEDVAEDIIYELNVLGAVNAATVLSLLGMPISIVYGSGYGPGTALKDDEIIISKSLLDALLQKYELDANYEPVYSFDKVQAADFEDCRFRLTLLDTSRPPSFTALKIVGVFDDAVDFDAAMNAATLDVSLRGVVLANPTTKNLFLEKSLVATNAYLPLTQSKGEQKKLLKILDGQNIDYLTYAATELETMNLLFKMLSQILGGISLVLFLFVMLLMLNFISASVSSKQKEIGILRAMGARGVDTAKIFIIEGAAVFLISLVLSIALSFVGIVILNAQLTKMFVNTISVLSPIASTFIIAAVGNALIITVGSLIPLVKIIKMKPIDAVKSIN
ncbi:MAG: ABC transporter ATP-binding protein/permease [Clostridiaceae bacterium]|jgi:ABC-type lipoprotein export system ATPase subunit|nr:ABC transporter ATP-binding protein/permease [Clostridiaceae bacterium]